MCLILPFMSGVIVVPCAILAAVLATAGIKLVGVPQPKSTHRLLAAAAVADINKFCLELA